MTRSQAETILRQFICTERSSEPLDYAAIREAVFIVADLSDYQILGICAETAEEGLKALSSYTSALKYDVPETRSIPGTIYIKFNPLTGRSHMEPYAGEHRGALVSCQSAFDDGVNETFGHLPLDLFDQ
ncbi:DUF1824 family protein [Leptolyngbya sp. NIES-2104]|uniref:DUF1824 family protein n=1 Tax=Leptolyngbya sp. NIES-2104 TaxID=1552121 RepID=UPI0006EC4C9B|nr:DUF1824 family protein [Leptolyngbya sp. NIES-2104]GAP97494.1 hypothetical protein NIES2104_40410 [Leptolyngbya sp. NIES-2104]